MEFGDCYCPLDCAILAQWKKQGIGDHEKIFLSYRFSAGYHLWDVPSAALHLGAGLDLHEKIIFTLR
jgi:hypothetical protein